MKSIAVAVCAGVAALFVSVGAWAQSVGFTEDMRTQFVSECRQGGGDVTLCQCVWNGIRAEYSLQQYSELSNSYATQQLHPNMVRQELIVANCKGDAPANGRYPAYTVQNFNTGCQGGGVSTAICSCMIDRLQQSVSFGEFVELDLMSAWGKDSEHHAYARMVDAAQQCVAANR
ncbi:MAG: hypothetical protein NVV62_17785 [Terricaulis sp.]|nr:hypothetical protein [Terricaulis sp.]